MSKENKPFIITKPIPAGSWSRRVSPEKIQPREGTYGFYCENSTGGDEKFILEIAGCCYDPIGSFDMQEALRLLKERDEK